MYGQPPSRRLHALVSLLGAALSAGAEHPVQSSPLPNRQFGVVVHRSTKVAFAAALCSLAVPAAASAATKSVVAGPPIKKAPAGVPKDGDINSFFPKSVKIHAGDSIKWTIAGFHVVNFP